MKQETKEWLWGVAYAAVFIAVAMLIALIYGCTAMTYEQQQAQAAAFQGCYCEGKGCKVITSAAGRAAGIAAGSEAASSVEVRGRQ